MMVVHFVVDQLFLESNWHWWIQLEVKVAGKHEAGMIGR